MLQGIRASTARCGGIRPERDRDPVDEGPLVIAVLDYGMGNLRSVEKAFEHVGAEVEITYDAERVRAAEGLVLPGVGAFPKAMEAIRERGLDELIDERRAAG